MNKISWLICICIFIFATVFTLSVDTSGNRRVKFTNQSFEIKNEGNEIVNDSNTKINLLTSNVENKAISANNSDVKVKTSNYEINHQKITYYSHNDEYNSQSIKINYKNLDDSELDAALEKARGYSPDSNNYSDMSKEEYYYKNIDWSKWKSNFVNKILDDSIAIKELDSYPNGSWFWYSFVVDNEGRISNVKVRSLYLSKEDKQKVSKLIKSYQYQPITRFPKKSKRKTASISAIMMLSNVETKHSKPSDFKDMEMIKYKK